MKNPILLSKEYGVVTRQREPDLSRSGTGTCNFCRQTILHSKTREGVNPNTTRIGGLANKQLSHSHSTSSSDRTYVYMHTYGPDSLDEGVIVAH